MSFSRPEDLDGPRACHPHELPGMLDLANLVMRTLETPKGRPPTHPSIGVRLSSRLSSGQPGKHQDLCASGDASSVALESTRRSSAPLAARYRSEASAAWRPHPDYRGLGLATQVMQDAHERMRSNRHHIGLLSTLIDDFYRKLGWETAGRQRFFTFDRGNIQFLPGGADLELTEDWRPWIRELNALHLQQPIVAPRSDGRFRLLMERKAARIFVGIRNGEVAAYACVGDQTVREYGGELEDAGALLKAVFSELDDPETSTTERAPGARATIQIARADARHPRRTSRPPDTEGNPQPPPRLGNDQADRCRGTACIA